MQSVLFKTSDPAAQEGMVEFYAVSILLEESPRRLTAVQEVHGWWNSQTGEKSLDQGPFSEPEFFESFSEAADRFYEVRLSRARAGFVHSFTWHCLAGTPTNHKLIDIPATRMSELGPAQTTES